MRMRTGLSPSVTTVGPADAERAIATVVLAFGTDPIARWSLPDPRDYLTYFPAIVRGMGGSAFAHGTADEVGGFTGAALWLPPGVHPDEETLTAVLERGVPSERQAEVAALLEEMARYHPTEAHWYLPLIGVDPTHQGQGLGGTLLQHALRRCDQDHLPAYLESTNPANVPLYERHGFEIVGSIQVGSSPPLVPMRRAAR